jgi:endonuclease/exonuclease/phosphatase family metal-dependent hydrolase
VIAPFFELLVHNEHIRSTYYFSGNSITDYGLLILSKWPAYFYDFPFENTWMERSLLVAETVFNGQSFLVCTSHLESLDNRLKRSEQINYIQNEVLQGYDAIFMGDFNFDFSWSDEGKNINRKLVKDLWEELKDTSEEAFTMNGTTRFKPVVLDHVLLMKKSQFVPEYIQRVGNFCCRNFPQDLINEIREDDVVRTPSDHLGLYSVIQCQKFT